jgi:hypothetical protein
MLLNNNTNLLRLLLRLQTVECLLPVAIVCMRVRNNESLLLLALISRVKSATLSRKVSSDVV